MEAIHVFTARTRVLDAVLYYLRADPRVVSRFDASSSAFVVLGCDAGQLVEFSLQVSLLGPADDHHVVKASVLRKVEHSILLYGQLVRGLVASLRDSGLRVVTGKELHALPVASLFPGRSVSADPIVQASMRPMDDALAETQDERERTAETEPSPRQRPLQGALEQLKQLALPRGSSRVPVWKPPFLCSPKSSGPIRFGYRAEQTGNGATTSAGPVTGPATAVSPAQRAKALAPLGQMLHPDSAPTATAEGCRVAAVLAGDPAMHLALAHSGIVRALTAVVARPWDDSMHGRTCCLFALQALRRLMMQSRDGPLQGKGGDDAAVGSGGWARGGVAWRGIDTGPLAKSLQGLASVRRDAVEAVGDVVSRLEQVHIQRESARLLPYIISERLTKREATKETEEYWRGHCVLTSMTEVSSLLQP